MKMRKNIPAETWNTLFVEISTSHKSLRTICKKLNLCFATVWSRLNNDEALLAQYARAKEEQSELLVEEILNIADDSQNDWEEVEGRKGTYFRLNREHFERSRLKIDTRKWIASKLKPKKYGDRLDVGNASGSPFEVVFNVPSKANLVPKTARTEIQSVVGSKGDKRK